MKSPEGPAPANLVMKAAIGDMSAYQSLVEAFTPLVWSICRGTGIGASDTEDVVQGVWLRVVQNLHGLREPEKFVGWIATITRNECSAVIRRLVRARNINQMSVPQQTSEATDAAVLAAERAAAVRHALSNLDDRCRQLLSMLSSNTPVPYVQISEVLKIPVASIGPTRARCLEKLRRNPAIVSIMER
jgi:RNA polymerase sigma factor (sigma-70 family)